MSDAKVDLDAKIKDFDVFLKNFSSYKQVDGVELFLHRPLADDHAFGWRRLNISGKFREKFSAELLSKVRTQYGKTDFVSYEYDAIVDEVIGVAPIDVFPGLEDFKARLPARTLKAMFDASPEEFPKYTTRAIALHSSKLDETAYLISRRSSFEVMRKAFLAKYSFSNHEFEKASDDVISFGYSVDFIVWRNCFFVDKDFPFQSITGFDHMMREKSKEALAEIESIKNVNILNMSELKECVDQYPGFRRKLAAASHSKAFKSFNPERAIAAVEEFGLPVEFDEVGGKYSFSFDLNSQSSRSKVIDLLSDNYVRGEATGLPYISSRKRPAK